MGKAFDIEPQAVKPVKTKFRRIVTEIPPPDSLPILQALHRCEPASMTGQPPVVWHRADGFQVYDPYGNMWLDWSSGVLVANAGHGAPEIKDAIWNRFNELTGSRRPDCHTERAELVQYLVEIAPAGLDKVFLLSTGAEAVENAIKLARTHGLRLSHEKAGIISFDRSFHGRTLGAQMVGGFPASKEWIIYLDPATYQVPFPDGFRTEDTSFDLFLKSLAEQGIEPAQIAGVITETFQGGGASFAPRAYIKALAHWCHEHDIVLIFDEIQAGFGRTGRLFGFEH